MSQASTFLSMTPGEYDTVSNANIRSIGETVNVGGVSMSFKN